MIRIKMICLLVLFLSAWGYLSFGTPKILDAAENRVYDFTLSNQNGEPVTLSKVLEDYRGAVIAFYPKNDSKD
jgi:hypothetical protein